MKRFVWPATLLVIGFVLGAVVCAFAYEPLAHCLSVQHQTHRAAKAIRNGDVHLGSAEHDPFLGKTRAYHRWTDRAGHERSTAIHQDKDRVVLIETRDGKVIRATLWEYGLSSAEVHLSEDMQASNMTGNE